MSVPKPELSIIIGLYNCLSLTRECLRSLEKTLGNTSYEVILVDDCSTDQTRSWLKTLREPYRVILNSKNMGFAKNNNLGARQARAPLLLLLNNDVVLTPNWFQPMLKLLESNPGIGVVGNVQRRVYDGSIDHCGIHIDFKGKPYHLQAPYNLFSRWKGYQFCPAVTGACMLMRRDLFLQMGGFNEVFRNGGEDVDFCFRLREAGYDSVVSLHSVIYHHVSASPGRNLHHEANCRLLFRKWGPEIARLGCFAWPKYYLRNARQSARAGSEITPYEILQAILCAMRLWPSPPAALRDLEANMAIEENRWQQILGPISEK